MIDLKKHTATWKISVIGSLSSAKVILPDVQVRRRRPRGGGGWGVAMRTGYAWQPCSPCQPAAPLRAAHPQSIPNRPLPSPPSPPSPQAGCPAVIHVIDAVLVPSLPEASSSAAASSSATAKAASKTSA